jgi:hypothetical protein
VQLVLRVPRWAPPPAPPPRRAAADSALGVQGIELREQSHEEALLSTIGARPREASLSVASHAGWARGARAPLPAHCVLKDGLRRRAACEHAGRPGAARRQPDTAAPAFTGPPGACGRAGGARSLRAGPQAAPRP